MSYYLFLPNNLIPFSILHKICYSRLNFLCNFSRCFGDKDINKFNERMDFYPEFMIPRSTKDSISHHIIRGLSTITMELWRTFVVNERNWFLFCINSMNNKEFIKFLKYLELSLRQIRSSRIDLSKTLQTFSAIFSPIFQQETFLKILTTNHERSKSGRYDFGGCQEPKFSFYVPYVYGTKLLAKRKVDLVDGMLYITSPHFESFLTNVCEMLLESSYDFYHSWARRILKHDSRMRIILEMLINKSPVPTTIRRSAPIKNHQIDELATYFPPCMDYLHTKLRFLHRLDHHSRIQYSLYLKSIGLPFEEALIFWRQEYERPINRSSSHSHTLGSCHPVLPACSHSWEGSDTKRYHYNLRHLYGLEGSRKNYSCHSCEHIQGKILKNQDLGGCPFRHFDETHLRKFLAPKLDQDHLDREEILSEIFRHRANKDYNKCCGIYLKARKICCRPHLTPSPSPQFCNITDDGVNKLSNDNAKCDTISIIKPTEFYYSLRDEYV